MSDLPAPSSRLLVTVNVMGDDEWNRRPEPTARNAAQLPGLHLLCRRFGLRPTYLASHDMLADEQAGRFLREVAETDEAEVGALLHPWRTPPLRPRYDAHPCFPSDLPPDLFAEKLRSLTLKVEEVCRRSPHSYRAGRFGLSGEHVPLLAEQGYRVDSSVTPWIRWSQYRGLPGGPGGPDFVGAPEVPYPLSDRGVREVGDAAVLEIPLSIRLSGWGWPWLRAWYAAQAPGTLGARMLQKLELVRRWELRPALVPARDLIVHAQSLVAEESPCLNLLVNSSELMAGGSPYSRTEEATARVWRRLEEVLRYATGELRLTGCTLEELGEAWRRGELEGRAV